VYIVFSSIGNRKTCLDGYFLPLSKTLASSTIGFWLPLHAGITAAVAVSVFPEAAQYDLFTGFHLGLLAASVFSRYV
jgi:hypothetical protein